MKYELTQEFYFEAAHTLHREVEADSSRRLHGHTYHAEMVIRGDKDPVTGMVIDLAHLRNVIDSVRENLDHHFLDEVDGLGIPTIENLCAYLWNRLHKDFPTLCRVTVKRKASGDSCSLRRDVVPS